MAQTVPGEAPPGHQPCAAVLGPDSPGGPDGSARHEAAAAVTPPPCTPVIIPASVHRPPPGPQAHPQLLQAFPARSRSLPAAASQPLSAILRNRLLFCFQRSAYHVLHVCFSEIFHQGARTLILQVRKQAGPRHCRHHSPSSRVPGWETDQSGLHDLSESPRQSPLSSQPKLFSRHGPSLPAQLSPS